MTGEALRKSNETELKQDLKPDFLKSDAEKGKEGGQDLLDSAASYLPGQGKTRDLFDSDAKDPNLTHDQGRAGGISNAFKPAGEETTGEWLGQKADQAGSKVQPDKSLTQKARDALTPGNDPHSSNQSGGLIDQAAGAVQGAVDTVANLFSGEKGTGTGTGTGTHGTH